MPKKKKWDWKVSIEYAPFPDEKQDRGVMSFMQTALSTR